MLEIRDLRHDYAGHTVLSMPSWDLARGEAGLVLGASGSGKSTLIAAICGLLTPTAGRVRIAGEDVTAMAGARPLTLFALLAAEGVTLVVAGVILGLALGHGAAEALGRWIARSNSWSVTGFAGCRRKRGWRSRCSPQARPPACCRRSRLTAATRRFY